MVKNEWLPWVKDRNDYAGNIGHAIDAIQSNCYMYEVHAKGGNWQIASANEICGTYGKPIDAVRFTTISYQ